MSQQPPKRPRAFIVGDDDWEPGITGEEVIEQDQGDTRTGLLDADGTPLYRKSPRVKLGFIR